MISVYSKDRALKLHQHCNISAITLVSLFMTIWKHLLLGIPTCFTVNPVLSWPMEQHFISFLLFPEDCNFEKGLCNWSNALQDQNIDIFDWRLNAGRTTSSNTGPTRDHTTGGLYGDVFPLWAHFHKSFSVKGYKTLCVSCIWRTWLWVKISGCSNWAMIITRSFSTLIRI